MTLVHYEKIFLWWLLPILKFVLDLSGHQKDHIHMYVELFRYLMIIAKNFKQRL